MLYFLLIKVSCWDFLCDKSKGAYPDEEQSKEEGDSGDSSLRLQTYKLQVFRIAKTL